MSGPSTTAGADAGGLRIDWAASWAPVLTGVGDDLAADGSVRGRRVAIVLPIEPKTAYLAVTLARAGADVTVTSPGALVDGDVAAALAARGVRVLARPDSTPDQQREFYGQVLDSHPEAIVDDRADLIRMAHTTHTHALDHLLGAAEETTSGVSTLRAMHADGALRVPCLAVNDARCKHLFDNHYGSGQSVLAAIADNTNMLIAGARLVIVGYGWVGKGLARRARGMGARITVCEIDPFAALQAHHDGFGVARLADAAASADLVITTSGCPATLAGDVLDALPDGAVIANASGIDDEIDMADLTARATATREVQPQVVEYRMPSGRSIFVIGDGVVVNLSAGEGHPVEIMDVTFAAQALAVRHLLTRGRDLSPGLQPLPERIDRDVAVRAVAALGLDLDAVTDHQRELMAAWSGR